MGSVCTPEAWAARVTCSAASSIIQQARLLGIDSFYLYLVEAYEFIIVQRAKCESESEVAGR